MSDAIPLPPRPNLDQYRKLARDLQRVAGTSEPNGFRQWASRWLETLARLRGAATPVDATDPAVAIVPELDRLSWQWRELTGARDRASDFKLADAQFFIARAHGFASWPAFAAHLEGLTQESSPVALFESAVDAIVAGDASTLRRLLRAHPELARARSTRDHRSTLLHYVSANGVEDFRQMTPANIVAMTELLLSAGADVNAASEAYGGGSTTLGLVATSIHPEQAGVQIELLETLLRHGAEIEGEQAGNGHGIVLGCLANGQPQAARFFAERGAQLNLVEAAGVGLLDRVRSFFDTQVSMHDLDSALQYAAGYGHADVVKFLLQRGANAGMADDGGQSPLHWATFGPHVEVARALLAGGAPVAARDKRFNATPLDWMVHAWATAKDSDARERGRDVTALLVGAGAVPDLDRFDGTIKSRVRADAGMMRALGLQPVADTTDVVVRGARQVVALDIKTAEINLCSMSPDGRRVLTASQGNPVTIFDARTGKREMALDSATVNSWLAHWTAKPGLVLVGSRDFSIELWNTARHEQVSVLRGHHGQPRAADTNADVTRALTGCSYRDTSVKLWDLTTGECLRTLEGHTDGVYAVAFHGEDRAASGSRDGTIGLWDLSTGRAIRALAGHTYHVHSVSWSGDGRRLLSSSMDLRLWDVETGRCLRMFEGHTEVIRSVVWSLDEKYALTASHDRTARIWNVTTGLCERVFEGHETGLVSAWFSPDGRRVFTCDWLGGLRVWEMMTIDA